MTSFTGLVPAGRAFLEWFTSRFWSKAVVALLLVLLADHFFLVSQGLTAGSTLGFFGLALLIFVWLLRVTRPAPVDYILAPRHSASASRSSTVRALSPRVFCG